MAELGQAYISVIPSMRGGAAQLTKELTGTTSLAGGKSGAGFAAGFGKTALKTMGAMGIATSVGAVFSKGFSRMTAIDNAKAKLTSLGHSVKSVEEISKNANAAVKGTAYGMDAAMTAAASATAAGIKPGKELTRYLSLMGDAAAVAGIDMSEMGSIFNKVAANGKITTEEMNQLADRGIPIWQLLAKETGMSMDEMRAAIQSGKLDINDLQNAIETGMGGAAKTIGSTTITGAISNINAAISRIGANFIGSSDDANSFAGHLLDLMNKLMSFMGVIEQGASVVGQVFGAVMGPIMEGLGQVFDEVAKGSGTLGPLKDVLLTIGNLLGSVIVAVMPVIIQAIRTAFTVLKPVVSIIKKITTALKPLMTMLTKVVAAFSKAASKIIKSAGKIASSVIKHLSFFGLAGKVASVFNTIKDKMTEPITKAKEKVKEIIEKVKGLFPLSVGKIFDNIKLPHFSISGGQAPWGLGGKGTKPTIGVEWYKKAESNPYLFNRATLFGAGERGDEILYGRKSLMRDIAAAAGGGRTITITNNIDGAENPELWGMRLARQLEMEMRA